MSDNGEKHAGAGGTVQQVDVDQMILTYDRINDNLEIGGLCSSLDRMLDILARATRTLDARWKIQQIQLAQQEAVDAQLRAELAARHKH